MTQLLRALREHSFEIDLSSLERPGIYVIFSGDELVYVGQSETMFSRVGGHLSTYYGAKGDRVFFIPLRRDQLDSYEGAFIRNFNSGQRIAPTDQGDDEGVLSQFGLSVDESARSAFYSRRRRMYQSRPRRTTGHAVERSRQRDRALRLWRAIDIMLTERGLA